MVFFYEPGDSFPLLTVLQMGRNYEHNEDGYVYVYSPNGNEEGSMNQLVMFRVPKDSILDRSAYEFFISLNSDGTGSWSRDIHARGVVHTFPTGWVKHRTSPLLMASQRGVQRTPGDVHDGELGHGVLP